MMKKVMVMAIVVILGFTVFAMRPAVGYAEDIQGYAVASEQDGDWYADPNVQWTDGTNYYGEVYAIELDDTGSGQHGADDAKNTGFGSNVNDNYDTFNWGPGGASAPVGWDNAAPDTLNEDLMFVAEYNETASSTNYTWCAHVLASQPCVRDPLYLMVRYEPIPQPVLNPNVGTNVGSSWINISIPHFKYTDYNFSSSSIENRGTFDTFKSYAVYIYGAEFGSWTYIGNSTQDPNSPQIDPALAAYDGGDPTGIDTGADYYNATGLGGGTYKLMVRPNFGPVGSNPGPVWGEGGGRGSITPFANGQPSAPINTPEFGTGMLIPVVATIGMFAAFTIYRRKKEN